MPTPVPETDIGVWVKRAAKAPARTRLLLEKAQGRHVWSAGRRLVNFASNNYLGLSGHPEILRAFADAADKQGMSACASQFVAGYTAPVRDLEQHLAVFTGRERAVVFSSGYLANLAAVTSWAGRDTVILADRLAHASLLDAARLSRATLRRYPHCDTSVLERFLQAGKSQVLVLSDGVFSMDGDIAPVHELSRLCRQYRALLVIDDAHGIGVLGPSGGGVLDGCSEETPHVHLLVGTLGKALGLSGGFVAGSEAAVEGVLRAARSAIYTTAILPGIAAAASTSLELLQKESWRRQRLMQSVRSWRLLLAERGIGTMNTEANTPIQPLLIGDDRQCLALHRRLLEAGFLVPAIRPPTVPQGSARLRISLTSEHEEQDLLHLAESLARILPLSK